jgi:outer membrane lipoprotein-sorting protein
MKKIYLLIFLFSISITAIYPQTKNPNKILEAVRQKFEKIKDYEVDVTAKLDINFLKVPETKAKIYFKQPDKVKMQSDGFAMLPKQSLNFSPSQLLKGNFNAVYVKSETVDNVKLDVVKVIPNNDSSDVILSTLWIDPLRNVIKKIQTTGKKAGTIQIFLDYKDESMSLPTQVKFSFNIGEMNMPMNLSNNNKNTYEERHKEKGPVIGNVTMTYSNYKINKGIPDSFFEEKK